MGGWVGGLFLYDSFFHPPTHPPTYLDVGRGVHVFARGLVKPFFLEQAGGHVLEFERFGALFFWVHFPFFFLLGAVREELDVEEEGGLFGGIEWGGWVGGWVD